MPIAHMRFTAHGRPLKVGLMLADTDFKTAIAIGTSDTLTQITIGEEVDEIDQTPAEVIAQMRKALNKLAKEFPPLRPRP